VLFELSGYLLFALSYNNRKLYSRSPKRQTLRKRAVALSCEGHSEL